MTAPRNARSERMVRIVTVASLAFSVVYITWRWGWTLNTDALWFSVPLVMAETYGLLTAFFLAFSAWRLADRRSPPPLPGRTVDVFVTTYDEPLAIIRKTALAAREIRYPHATYILDDGRRDEVRRLAAEIGVSYLTRETNEHAKAGNLNNALANSSGDFILQLDADHVPLPQMVHRLIGFFADDRVAFVQSPQDFYNTDAFTYEVDVAGRRIWEDQQLFFRVLQPGKDRVNAAFFVGSCALVRRQALEEIGGFATATITEDIETSLLLHARGWKSVYLNETLAYGLAPSTALAFHVQHLRWGQGAMQTLKRYKPLRMRGLSLAQRLGYLDSLTTYLGGFQRLILYMAPLVFFVTGVFPLEASATAFLLLFVPYLALQLWSFKLLTRGHGSVLLADRFAMAKFFTHVMAITGYTTRRRLGFRVTPKEAGRVPAGVYAPQTLLIAATLAALGFAVYERTLGVAPEEVPGWGAVALWVNVAYALWNAAVAAYIVRASLGGQHRRVEHRFAEALAVTLRVIRADGKLSSYDIAVTENLNPHGAAVRCMNRIEAGSRVEMVLPLHWRDVSVRGRMVHRTEHATPYGTVHVHGVEFDGLDAETRDAIELHCAQHATPMERQRYQEGVTAGSGMRRFRNLRHQARLAVGMPVRIIASSADASRSLGVGLLEDVSPLGARMLLDHPVAPGSMLRLEVPGSALVIEGRVVFVHALETSVGVRYVAGLETPGTGKAADADPHWIDGVLASAGRYRVAALARAAAVGETLRRTMVAAMESTRGRLPTADVPDASNGLSHGIAGDVPAPAARSSAPSALGNDTYPTVADVVAATEVLAEEARNDLPVERYDIVDAVAVSVADAEATSYAAAAAVAATVETTPDMHAEVSPAAAMESAAASDDTPIAGGVHVALPQEIEADVLQFAPVTADVHLPEVGHAAPLDYAPVTATVEAPRFDAPEELTYSPITASVQPHEIDVPSLVLRPIEASVRPHEIDIPATVTRSVEASVAPYDFDVPSLETQPIVASVEPYDIDVPSVATQPIAASVAPYDIDVPAIVTQSIEASVAAYEIDVPSLMTQPIVASVEAYDIDVPSLVTRPIEASVEAYDIDVPPMDVRSDVPSIEARVDRYEIDVPTMGTQSTDPPVASVSVASYEIDVPLPRVEPIAPPVASAAAYEIDVPSPRVEPIEAPVASAPSYEIDVPSLAIGAIEASVEPREIDVPSLVSIPSASSAADDDLPAPLLDPDSAGRSGKAPDLHAVEFATPFPATFTPRRSFSHADR